MALIRRNTDNTSAKDLVDIMRENFEKAKALREMEEASQQQAAKIIPINNNTFPGVADSEKERFAQMIPSVAFEENGFLFNPANNTVELNGTLTTLAGLKFKFSTDVSSPGSGCFVYVEGLSIDDDSLQLLGKLYGYYKTFEKNWATSNVEQVLGTNKEQIERLSSQQQ